MKIELDNDAIEQMDDEALGQHFRYLAGEAEKLSDDDIEPTDLESLADDIETDESGLPRRITLDQIKDMSDVKLGKLMRDWIKKRIDRKAIDVIVYKKGDVEGWESDGKADEDNETFTLKNVAIFATGTYKKRIWELADLKTILANFKKFKNKITPPLKIGHDKQPKVEKGKEVEQPAIGWISGLKLKGNTLYADITDIPRVVYNLFVKKAYKRISSEIYLDYQDDNGKKHGFALAAVSVLGSSAPAVSSLPAIDARYAVYTKAISENDVEEFDFEMAQEVVLSDVAEDTDEGGDPNMPDEIKETTEEVATEPTEPTETEEKPAKVKTEEKEEKKTTETPKETPNPVSDEIAEQMKKLQTENVAMRKALQQLETDRKAEKVAARHIQEQSFIDKMKEEGKLLPANEGLIKSIFDGVADIETVIKFSEKVDGKVTETDMNIYDLFRKHLDSLSAIVDFSERANGGAPTKPGRTVSDDKDDRVKLGKNESYVGEELHEKIEAYQKDHAEEVAKYAAEHPEVSEYEAAMILVQI